MAIRAPDGAKNTTAGSGGSDQYQLCSSTGRVTFKWISNLFISFPTRKDNLVIIPSIVPMLRCTFMKYVNFNLTNEFETFSFRSLMNLFVK